MTDTSQSIGAARPQDEMLPFLNNFHDIFTTIGVLILLGGLAVGTGQVMAMLDLAEGEQGWQAVLMGLIGGIAVIVWLLSSLLVGRQRRILPGIVLSGAFAVAAAVVLIWGYAQFLIHGIGVDETMIETPFDALEDNMEFGRDAVMQVAGGLPLPVRVLPVVFALACLLPVAAYYLNFRLPFAGGLAGVGLVGLAVATLFTLDPYTTIVYMPSVSVAAGAALLFAGIVFDMRDPERQTRLSGTAFWLHFFAAPVLLTAVLNVTQIGWTLSEADFANPEQTNLLMALGADDGNATRLAATALVVIGIFALLSLLINRRALIVSGLLTAGISIGVIVNSVGLDTGAVIALTLLLLGGAVVLLGAAWNPVRRILLAPLPSGGPLARIFPPANGLVG
ncbi:hypothetical protein [Maricaulis sp.]|uniref:hypothetical protein n=1 Tax=Maricaulis sp. TaxID=1486257 RepID=UPI00261F8CA0|nr:hypothetical protein [Maricaulis sp.]